MLAILIITSACDNAGNKTTPTPTVAIRTTAKSDVTPTPSPEITAEPTIKPTIELGKHTYAGGIKSEDPIDLYYFDNSKENKVMVLTESIAIRFFPTTELKNIYISCPSMNDNKGTLTFEVFPWLGTYEKSIEGTAVLEKSFEDYADNTLIKLSFDTPIPDGEYIILLTSPDPENGVGIWAKSSDFEGQLVYADGVLLEDTSAQMQITYANTPNNKYGPVSED